MVRERGAIGGNAYGEVRDRRIPCGVGLEVVGVEVDDILAEETFDASVSRGIGGLVV